MHREDPLGDFTIHKIVRGLYRSIIKIMKVIRCHDFTLRDAKPNSVINHILNIGLIDSRGYYDDCMKRIFIQQIMAIIRCVPIGNMNMTTNMMKLKA